MKKRYSTILLLTLLLGLSTGTATAQEWVTYESEQFDLQFDLPADWDTEVDEEMVISTGGGVVFVLAAVKDESISTLELFNIQVETLDMDAEGEYEEIELRGGILGIIGSGVGVIDGDEAGLILLAATLDENNYIAYIFAVPEAFETYENTMVEILTSLAPLGWVD